MKSKCSSVFRRKAFNLIFAAASSTVGLIGCSTATTTAQWAEPADMRGEFSVIDDSERQWSKRIGQLPVELHGAWPGNSLASIAELIPQATLADDKQPMITQQRVVVYVGGTEVPQREDFCAVNKSYRAVANDKKVTIRTALCDGPRIISYAKKSVDGDAANIAKNVASLESSLVGALQPPFNFLDVEG